ncbi:MAG: translation initiation factor IF-1 [Chloroflexi bacterium]|nr:translation initiation factor IF-1 [Chloroflexota bacterium]
MDSHDAPGRATERLVELEGHVRRSLANDLYEVELADGQHVLVHLAASARLRATRIGAGDRVRVALARYDHTRGRITGRL